MSPVRAAVYAFACMLSFSALARAAEGSFAQGLDDFDRGRYAQALHVLEPLARGGDARAQYRMGLIYAMGLGVARNYELGVSWLGKAAAKGNSSAQNDLGTLYDQGRGVPPDPAEAAKLFHDAAVRGHAAAQLNLAELYRDGRGVDKNPEVAYAWANCASELGEFRAQRVLDSILRQLEPGRVADAERLAEDFRKKYVAPFQQH
jgi:TPR repeat protein